jgi:hypothetical protein
VIELSSTRVSSRHAGRPRLDHCAGLDDVRHREVAQGNVEPQQAGHRASGGRFVDDDRPRGCACPGSCADELQSLEHAEGFANGAPADAELLGELALAREAVARSEAALKDLFLDLVDHPFPGPLLLDALEIELAGHVQILLS